jgi:hypothetical protein
LLWDIIPSCVIFDDLKFKNIIFALQFFLLCKCFLFSMVWAWILLLQFSQSFHLNVVYHSKYFFVMCCECGDNESYKHLHRSTRHPSSPAKHKITKCKESIDEDDHLNATSWLVKANQFLKFSFERALYHVCIFRGSNLILHYLKPKLHPNYSK